ncbi:MAG TPA: phenylalanine--tRNA ligase beta subunit-related protein [Candidatus Acidoferrum sp.]|nr:phenylalanine--tRNA ligase beta subunit-related protein [Candidatus Acidoferrum sp.]
MQIQVHLPGVKLGVLEADGILVSSENAALSRLLAEACEQKRAQWTLESLAEAPFTRAVRSMFRSWGMDPSRYRPSSEALLRRVVQGKGLYRISNVVDVGNLISIETGWPLGCYDRSRIAGPVAFRHGAPGETYQGIGKQMWHLEGRPVLADSLGPFGSPVSDSTRSMITESARDILIVIYCPESASTGSLELSLSTLSSRLSAFCSVSASRSEICS